MLPSMTLSTQPLPQPAYCRTAKLFYLLEGDAAFTYGSRQVTLGRSDILVINRGTEYCYTGSENLLLASLELTGETFESACDGIRRFVDCNSAADDNEFCGTLRGFLRQMLLNQFYVDEDKQKYAHLAFAYYSLYYKLLETLVSHFVKSYSSQWGPALPPEKSSGRREEIEQYVGIHYMEPIGLDDISDELFISKSYLSKYFSRTFGISFSQYLKELRLQHAMSDLLYTDLPITQIIFDNGFSSSSFFNRAFREKFGQNPREVRSRYLRENGPVQKPPDQRGLQSRVKELLDVPAEPAGQAAVCLPPNLSGKTVRHCWGVLINLGSASELLRTDIQSHIQILSKYFTYARFWDPFSKEMLLDVNHPGTGYNFLRLDQLFDSLLSLGMKPFVVFEPKLERVNEGVDSVIIRAQHDGVIDSIHAWDSIITAFVRHIVQKYGEEEVSQWKFELTYGVYRLRDMEELESYLAMFRSLSAAVRRYVPQLMVGGPTLLSAEMEACRQVLLGLKAIGCEPDFISMTSFAYEVNERAHRYSLRSIDEEYLLEDVKRFRREMEECGFEDRPLYITEWNETVADRNFLNDSCYRGAYVVKDLLDVYPYVDAIGYFSGTDLRAEYFDSGALLQGGNGLLSRDGIFKPAGFAIQMMNRLCEYHVGGGKGFLITSDGRGSYTVIVHNKRKLGPYFYKTPEWKIAKEELARYREDEQNATLALELTGVEAGEYRVRTHRVNAQYGSILDLWHELDYSQNLSRRDIQYLQRICEPHLHLSAQRVTDGKLTLDLCLEPDEFLLVEVSRSL